LRVFLRTLTVQAFVSASAVTLAIPLATAALESRGDPEAAAATRENILIFGRPENSFLR
jgi:hypothetical protein